MNLKRLFPGLCLALLIVSEVFLFRANHDRDLARSSLRTAQDELTQAQTELDSLKGSNASAQSIEVERLRRLNEILASKNAALQNKNASLQSTVNQLQQVSQQTAQHLDTARTALELQQEHLQQIQADKQQTDADACIDNLRQIDAAKQQWALDKNADANAVPTVQDLTPYFKDGAFPVCPDGGTYTINSMTQAPVCSYPGHTLPPPAPMPETGTGNAAPQ